MYESLSLTTKGGNDAAIRVRSALRALNGGLGEKSDDVRLLTTELVTNAVVHAGVDCTSYLQFELSAPQGRISAALEYPGEPFTAGAEPEEGHYGLYLVELLSDAWGFERTGDRNRVWFEISR
jgi:anti-sigma regulatory factor (Ser/Thr protein kinase)